MTRRPQAAALLLAAALAVTGCATGDGGGDEGAVGTTTTLDATTTTVGSTTTTTTTAGAAGGCSASGLDADLPGQERLPPPVAETRRRIVEAATACDHDALGALAEGTDEAPFTYSFGDSGDPVGFWRRTEEAGTGAPLRHLVEILHRPHGTVEVSGTTGYAWPSAFSYDSWDEVPEAERQALQPLYDEEDLERFDRFGGYVGYRAVILEDGTWTVFVAGD